MQFIFARKYLLIVLVFLVTAFVGVLTVAANADGKPLRVTISGKVMAKKVQTRVAPIYPAGAKKSGVEGTVRLHVIIGTDGSVKQVQVVSGHPALVHSAVEAVKQWIYEPYSQNGQIVEVDTVVDLNYQLKP